MKNAKGLPTRETGQVLVAVLAVLAILSAMVPLMVMYAQYEAKWTNKQSRNTTAFHVAEAGQEKAYLEMTLSTSNWVALMAGNSLAHYNFDKAYQDISGGSYVISITSGPQPQQATVITIGRDSLKEEVRAIKAIYANSPLGNVAIFASGGVSVGGKVTVEWGAIVSPQPITYTTMPTHPQLWSAGAINPICSSPSCGAYTDGKQWWAYNRSIPVNNVDPTQYKPIAEADASCGGIVMGSTSRIGCHYTCSPTCTWDNANNNNVTSISSKTVYIDGDLNQTTSSNKVNLFGNLIITGSLTTAKGDWGTGCTSMTMPQTAWKQYANAWTGGNCSTNPSYDCFCTGACAAGMPGSFPGLTSGYRSPSGFTYTNCPPNKMAVRGLVYIGGNLTENAGGGNTDIYGDLILMGSATLNGQTLTVYFNQDVPGGLLVSKIAPNRLWWQDTVMPWTCNTDPNCN